MRISEFWVLMNDEFGRAYAKSVATDQTMAALSGLTAEQALQEGHRPASVWQAVCDHMGVPAERRLGKDRPSTP